MTAAQHITPAALPAAAAALAKAFADDPVMGWLTGGNPARFAVRARGFFAETARRLSAAGGGWITDGGEAAALWAPPDRWRVGLADTARLAPSSLRLYGVRLPRAMRALASIEAEHPRAPHWYLSFLGTAPAFQGKGLGAALLEPVLARCDRDGLPAFLESSNERNLPFYERHGFEVTGTHDFPRGPRLWAMWRDANVAR